MKQDDVYIGDGLYAAFDGWGFTLRARRGGREHWVYLEPEVYVAFRRFVENVCKPALSTSLDYRKEVNEND